MRVPPDQSLHVAREPLQGAGHVAGAEPRGQARERGVEGEDLGAARDLAQREDEGEQEARAGVHRPAGVAQDDQAGEFDGPRAARQFNQFAAVGQRAAEAPAHVHHRPALGRHQPAARPGGDAAGEALQQALHVAEVVRGAFVEDLPAQERARAVAGEVAVGVGDLRFAAAGPFIQFAADAGERGLGVLVAAPAARGAGCRSGRGRGGGGRHGANSRRRGGRTRPTSGAGS